MEADVKQDGHEGGTNARTLNGRSNDIVMYEILVFFGQHLQKQILQFGRLQVDTRGLFIASSLLKAVISAVLSF
jgi:hypothetical protein